MSDFVPNFDLLSGLSLDEWLKETDGMEKEEKKERRHAEINERDIEYLEKSRNEVATVTQTMWSVRCFQSWCAEKKETGDFQSIGKTELNQILRQFYATVKNGKGEAYGFRGWVGLCAGLNHYIKDQSLLVSDKGC